MSRILVVAPHPDDETLGCGGTLLRHRRNADQVHWLIVTAMKKELGYDPGQIEMREKEILAITQHYDFSGVHKLNLPTTRLDTIPFGEIVKKVADVLGKVQPEVLYIPFGGDVHSDHRIVAEACSATSKWFRNPTLRELCAYETLSETDCQTSPSLVPFRPSLYVDIHEFLTGKIDALKLYANEIAPFPFPRSPEAVFSLAQKRGMEAGFHAAEAYMVLKQLR